MVTEQTAEAVRDFDSVYEKFDPAEAIKEMKDDPGRISVNLREWSLYFYIQGVKKGLGQGSSYPCVSCKEDVKFTQVTCGKCMAKRELIPQILDLKDTKVKMYLIKHKREDFMDCEARFFYHDGETKRAPDEISVASERYEGVMLKPMKPMNPLMYQGEDPGGEEVRLDLRMRIIEYGISGRVEFDLEAL